jgi:tetratricopeptide (TPR) repeat protein
MSRVPPPLHGSPPPRRRRLPAVLLGLGILLVVELLLRLAGFGGPGDRPDPFGGFSPGEPHFVRDVNKEDEAVLRVRDDRLGALNAESFPESKPADEVRLFCLGGSSTFGFPYNAGASFCRHLEDALASVRPSAEVRVVNCGAMSYGSRRVLNLLREVAAHEPDGFVIYTGHNEYVERRFFAPFLEEPPWRRTTRGLLNRSRLYVALRRILALAAGSRQAETGDLFGVGPVRDDSRRLRRTAAEDRLVAENFRFVLDEMAAVARNAGKPLFLVRPAANLRDWAPEASDFALELPEGESRRRDAALASARRLWNRGSGPAALEAVEEALRLDSTPAMGHYLRGTILLALGRRDEAVLALSEARDRDAAPIRITGPLSRAIADAWDAHDLPALDAAAALARESPEEIVGHEMILDYCHPTLAGHRRIAAMLVPAIQRALWPGEPVRPVDWRALEAGEGVTGNEPSSAFGAAWAGQMLLRQGETGRARELFERAVSLDPELATAREGLGRTLAMAGDLEGAIRELEEATRLDPQAPQGWNNLGLVYLAADRPAEAARAFRRALEAGVGGGIVRRNLAGALLDLDLLEAARREIELAIQESPADPLNQVRLGQVAARQGDAEKAREAFLEALSLDPAAPGARQGLAALGADGE